MYGFVKALPSGAAKEIYFMISICYKLYAFRGLRILAVTGTLEMGWLFGLLWRSLKTLFYVSAGVLILTLLSIQYLTSPRVEYNISVELLRGLSFIALGERCLEKYQIKDRAGAVRIAKDYWERQTRRQPNWSKFAVIFASDVYRNGWQHDGGAKGTGWLVKRRTNDAIGMRIVNFWFNEPAAPENFFFANVTYCGVVAESGWTS